MASHFDAITEAQADLLRAAKLFFVATADPARAPGPHGVGAINVSPKGGVPLLLIGPTRVAWIDYPGSGNETARHAQAGSPVTLMACSFDENDAAIVRLYGRATVDSIHESPYADALLDGNTGPTKNIRQVIVLDVESTMTSCGYGVPVMEFVRQRGPEGRGRRYKE
jgi:hypothetical protein